LAAWPDNPKAFEPPDDRSKRSGGSREVAAFGGLQYDLLSKKVVPGVEAKDDRSRLGDPLLVGSV
jgi:hypothetical protein